MTGTGRGRAAESGGGVAVTAAARGGTVDQGDATRIHRRCTVALADAPWFEGSDAGFRRRSWSHWLPVVEPRARA